jgi:RNA polymerase sigma-70 factor (ECF subfamily)
MRIALEETDASRHAHGQTARAAPVNPAAAGQASATDAALVRAVQQGDSEAFEVLVRRHLKAVHAAALALAGDSDDADDICQDTFIAALRKIAQCREGEHFRAWVLAIARNRSHDHRSRSRSMVRDLDGLEATEASPARHAARSEMRTHLEVALASLTALQRRVLLLHDYEGWRHGEISDELGISNVSSRFNLHVARRNARAKLKTLYGKE